MAANGHGGPRPGSGRKPGSRPKAIVDAEEQAKRSLELATKEMTGELTPQQIAAMKPLDVMLFAMQLEARAKNWKGAAVMAEKAAPYVHARLVAQQVTVHDGDADRSEDDIIRELTEISSVTRIAVETRVMEDRVPEKPARVVN